MHENSVDYDYEDDDDDDNDTDDDMTDAFCQQIEMRNWFDYYYYMMMMSGNSDPYLKPSEWHYFLKADYLFFFA